MDFIFGKPINITIHSPYRPDECAARLSAAFDHEGLFTTIRFIRPVFTGSKAVAGALHRHRFRLRMQQRTRNIIQHIMVGTLQKSPDGSVFRGSFVIHVLVRRFIVIGCMCCLAFCIANVAAGFTGTFDWGEVAVRTLVAAFAVAYTMLVARVSRVNAEEDLQLLTDFLNTTLGVCQIPAEAVYAGNRHPD